MHQGQIYVATLNLNHDNGQDSVIRPQGTLTVGKKKLNSDSDAQECDATVD